MQGSSLPPWTTPSLESYQGKVESVKGQGSCAKEHHDVAKASVCKPQRGSHVCVGARHRGVEKAAGCWSRLLFNGLAAKR